jgi:hypothetical protein
MDYEDYVNSVHAGLFRFMYVQNMKKNIYTLILHNLVK